MRSFDISEVTEKPPAKAGGAPNSETLSQIASAPGFIVDGKETKATTTVGISYTTVECPMVTIEWARVKNDYIYQWRPKKPPAYASDRVALILAANIGPLIPSEIHVDLIFPDPVLEISFWTLKILDAGKLPGATTIMEKRIVEALQKIDVWTLPIPGTE